MDTATALVEITCNVKEWAKISALLGQFAAIQQVQIRLIEIAPKNLGRCRSKTS